MFFNYIKAAIRSLLKQKGQTIIGIISLTGGLVCSIMISLWLRGVLSWEFFAASAMLTLIIALLTASYHALKAALTNPVNALRHE